jgi:hypothetical protein
VIEIRTKLIQAANLSNETGPPLSGSAVQPPSKQ